MLKSISTELIPPRLPERGKIKIGGKGEEKVSRHGKTYRQPVKFSHFVVTGVVRDETGNFVPDSAIMEKVGEAPKELDIMLLYDTIELNFPHMLAYYEGKKRICFGDGTKAFRIDQKTGEESEVKCTCPLLKQNKCKVGGRLSVLLTDAATTGGTYVFRTHGWNSVSNIVNSLRFIQSITGGVLAGIPLKLKVFPKAVETDTYTGEAYVVTIEYDGAPAKLALQAVDVAKARLASSVQMKAIEAGRLSDLEAHPYEDVGESEEDVAEEYYPEIDIESLPLNERILENMRINPVTGNRSSKDPLEWVKVGNKYIYKGDTYVYIGEGEFRTEAQYEEALESGHSLDAAYQDVPIGEEPEDATVVDEAPQERPEPPKKKAGKQARLF